jgi:hypothetical protein
LGQTAFVLLVICGVWRTGLRSLVAWAIPAVSIASGTALVALGRYEELGGLVTRIYSYAYDVAVPLLLGVCLALIPLVGEPRRTRSRDSSWKGSNPVTALLVVVVVAVSCVSTVRFVDRFSQAPAHSYMNHLTRSIESLPPGASVYDTVVSDQIVPYFSENHYLSDVVPLTGKKAAFDAPNSEPYLIDASGNLTPSAFFPSASALPTSNSTFCNNLLADTPLVLSLDDDPGLGDWFLRLEYFRQDFGNAKVTVIDQSGQTYEPVGGADVRFDSALGIITLRLPPMKPKEIVITPSHADNVCLTRAAIGAPLKASK